MDKNTLLDQDDFAYEEVTIPEWGGKLLVRELSGEGREEFEALLVGDDGDHKNMVRALVTAWCLCGTDKVLMFDPRKDIAKLSRKPYRILRIVAEAVTNISNTSAKALEDAEKNS